MAGPLVAAYRLQLRRSFTFDDAAELADYLAALGVSHVYASPILQARPDSAHGYDVVDPGRISAELGGDDGFERLRAVLSERGLGLVLDIVPNHMAAAPENPWWWDVLAQGADSPYARCFDVDWTRGGKIVLPILSQPYERTLAEGDLRVRRDGERFVLATPASSLPLSGRSLELVAHGRLDALNADTTALGRLIGEQHYRLVHWRRAATELNYRRFFDVSDLVGLRVEDDAVFELAHALVVDLLGRDGVDGVRIDHVDGLRDPEAYLRRLRARVDVPRVWVEKILHPGEELPETWPVDGTTGYELLRAVDGLFLDPSGREPLSRFYAEFTGATDDFEAVVHASKLRVLDALFPAEVDRLAAELATLATHARRPAGPREARTVVRAFLASFPVYRTYLRPGLPLRDEDRRRITRAAERALEQDPELDIEFLAFLCDVLLGRRTGEREAELGLRFQQFAPAVAAKGVEDTALYRYHRLVALNEVGGDPSRFGVGIDEFHRTMERAATRHPFALVATSTHDCKRSEDVRCRLAVLSELPEHWRRSVERWAAHHAKRNPVPDRNTEYLLYQTLVGAWPIGVERVQAYLRKAVREAKVHTSWTEPDDGYERALAASVDGMMADDEFRSDLASASAPIVAAGRVNSLAELLIKLTAPGIPDLYQGTELWNLRLVDPDNRSPVDFALRRRLLAQPSRPAPEDVWANGEPGRPKLWVLQRALHLRRRRTACFGPEGGYEALRARGEHRAHVVAFLRGGRTATVVPRLGCRVGGAWSDTTLDLPAGRWRNELTGEAVEGGAVRIDRLLARFPVALLARAGGS